MDTIFPDEIFLEIFRYIPRLDLFRGFYNLNSRFNRIISEARVYIYSQLNEEEQRYILPYVRPEQIRSFSVNEEIYQYSKLDQCINIRDLTFHSGSKYNVDTHNHPQLIHVQPSIFPHLKQLTIYVQSWSSVYVKLCIMIFGNQFPVLEYVFLPYANGSCVSSIQTWSTSLKHVVIQCCNKSMFYPLLENLPNMTSFTCALGKNNSGSLKKQCLSLRALVLETYDRSTTSNDYYSMMGFNEMIDLYQCLPNLENTILYIFDSGSLEKIVDQLNHVLSNCPKLKRFHCHIGYNRANSVSIDEIIKRYPLFQNCQTANWKASRGYGCRIRKY